MHPQNQSRANRLFRELQDRFGRGQVNEETFNHYAGQMGTRMSTDAARAQSLDQLNAVVRFASFVPEGTFKNAAPRIPAYRVADVIEEFQKNTGVTDPKADRKRATPATATRLSHTTVSEAEAAAATPGIREFWRRADLLPTGQ